MMRRYHAHHVFRHVIFENPNNGALFHLPGFFVESVNHVSRLEGFNGATAHNRAGGKTLIYDPKFYGPEPPVVRATTYESVDACHCAPCVRGHVTYAYVGVVQMELRALHRNRGGADYSMPYAVDGESQGRLRDKFGSVRDNHGPARLLRQEFTKSNGFTRPSREANQHVFCPARPRIVRLSHSFGLVWS